MMLQNHGDKVFYAMKILKKEKVIEMQQESNCLNEKRVMQVLISSMEDYLSRRSTGFLNSFVHSSRVGAVNLTRPIATSSVRLGISAADQEV